MRRWPERARRRLLTTPAFAIDASDRENPRTGGVHTFFTLDVRDWVTVVALTPEREVILVRQWRAGPDATTLETPGGIIEAGEAPEAAARRELLEETGYAPERLWSAGTLAPNPAFQGNRCFVFAATGCRSVAALALDAGEDVAVQLLPAAQVFHDGAGIDHAVALAALFLARPTLLTP